MRRIALLAGATGLVGRELLPMLLDDSDIEEVVVLSRRPIATPHPKLQQGVVAFDQLHNFVLPQVDDFYCCLGTTLAQAGSRDAFRQVDLVYPVTIARMALAAGATRCFFVSSMGADPQSRVFYNRVKGEVERELMGLELQTVYAFRPSLLTGARAQFRLGERVAQVLALPLSLLLPPKVRPIAAAEVARAMHACGRRSTFGRFVILSDEIRRIASKAQFTRLGSSTSPQL
ncbi:MAG: NAD-dependent epimerase/dehydratase family protein [Betaproteobacteria bacterium]